MLWLRVLALTVLSWLRLRRRDLASRSEVFFKECRLRVVNGIVTGNFVFIGDVVSGSSGKDGVSMNLRFVSGWVLRFILVHFVAIVGVDNDGCLLDLV